MRTEEAVRKCFAGWRDFTTRAKRDEFWHYFSFFLVGILCVGWLANEAVFWVGFGSSRAQAVIVTMQLAMLTLYVPFLASVSRRFADVGLPRSVSLGAAVVLLASTVVFVLYRDQVIDAGFTFIAPITHVTVLAVALLPSSKRTPLPHEVPQ